MSHAHRHRDPVMPLLFALNAITRVYFSLQTGFSSDEVALYHRVSQFLLTGQMFSSEVRLFPNELPGILPEIVLGFPLWLTGGWLKGPAIFIALLSAFSALVLARLYHRFFPSWDQRALFVAIAFAPWTYIYTGFNGSAFLFPLSVAVVWSVAAWAGDRAKPVHAVTLGVSILFAAQFNLAAVFLMLWPVVTWVGLLYRDRSVRPLYLPHLALGFLLGGLTVLPAFLGHSFAGQSTTAASLLHPIRFEWDHFETLYKVFFRFISFPTAELTRFLGGAQGVLGALSRMARSPVLLASGVVSLAIVGWVSFWSARFLLQNAVYHLKARDESPESARFRVGVALAPWLMMVLFLFSKKAPMPHTLLPLLPLSFFPFFWQFRARPLPLAAVSLAAVAQLTFGLGGYMRNTRPTLLTTSHAVECMLRDPTGLRCPRSQREALLEADPKAVQLIATTVRAYQSTRR